MVGEDEKSKEKDKPTRLPPTDGGEIFETYDPRDYAIVANNIFNRLNVLDEQDKNSGRQPEWHNINALAEEVKAYDSRIDVAYLTEAILHDQLKFIERDPENNKNVRLSELGRQNASKGINIPPSDIQKLMKRLGMR